MSNELTYDANGDTVFIVDGTQYRLLGEVLQKRSNVDVWLHVDAPAEIAVITLAFMFEVAFKGAR